jgi:hypothetical protein
MAKVQSGGVKKSRNGGFPTLPAIISLVFALVANVKADRLVFAAFRNLVTARSVAHTYSSLQS